MAIEISRIEREFIIKFMNESKGHVELVRGGHKAAAILENIVKGWTFRVTEGSISGRDLEQSVDVFFFFKGTRITCRSKVIEDRGPVLLLEDTQRLYRDLTRSYERIRPEEEIKVSLLLGTTTLKLDFPQYVGVNESEPPEVNIKFDAAKISDLLRGFRDKAKSFANEHKIIMFRERIPQQIVEHLVAWSGKILMLPVSDSNSPFKRREEDRKDILQEHDIQSIIKSSGKDTILLNNELSNHVDGMFQKKIWHELYVPILYRQYVIGYIYLLRSEGQVSQFSPSVIEFVRQFSRILAYSLAANNYFQAIPSEDSFEKSELVDISGSGLLFSMPLTGPSIDLLSDIDLKLYIKQRVISLQGRVMRRFQETGRIFIGIKFLEISEEDLDFLFNSLYGSPEGFNFTDEPIIPEF